MSKKLHALGEHFKFGGGQNVKINDAIIIPASGSSPSKAAVVTETGAVIQDRRTGDYHFGIRVRTASSNTPIERLYLDYGTTWMLSPGVPPIAPAVPFGLNGNWRVMAGVGLPLNPSPTNPSVNPPGWTGQGTKYSQRGHLIANRFWGPNGNLDNIVAMTITANQSGMKIIENRIATLIIATGDIYTIEAEPLPAGKQPPDEIQVRITKIYPPPKGAAQVFGPVNNT
jgi:hypothetical protein